MTAQLAPTPVAKFFDNNGNPLAGGQLFTYQAGTTTPQATYVDSTQTTPNTNPVILNARGEANVWLNPLLTYKFVLQDSSGNQIWAVDNINGSLVPNGNIVPSADNSFTLGSNTASWANLYLGPNHAPALDTGTGNILYYAQTAAERAAAIVPTAYSYPPYDLRRYGADPTGTNPSDAAMVSALAVCGTAGGTIRLPNGTYTFANQIILTSRVGIILSGDGDMAAAGFAGTIVNYTGTGSTTFITAAGSTGCELRDIFFGITATYSGSFIALGSTASFFKMWNCSLGSTANLTATLVNLDASVNCYFQRVSFSGGLVQVSGQNASGSSFSNVITFRDCQFTASANNPIAYLGESWTIDGCTFEGVASSGNVVAGAIGTIALAPAKNLIFRGCWLGDINHDGGTWITYYGLGCLIEGNRFGGSTGSDAISINSASAVSIRSNTFNSFGVGVSFDTATNVDAIIQDNYFTGVATPIGGLHLPAQITYNPNSPFLTPPTGFASLAQNGYRVDPLTGTVDQWGVSSVTEGTPLAVTFNTHGINFPTACWQVLCTLSSPSGASNTVYISATSSTGFTVNVAGTAGSNSVFWRAIGN